MSQPEGGHIARDSQAERIASGWAVEMEDLSRMGSLDWNPPVINETVLPRMHLRGRVSGFSISPSKSSCWDCVARTAGEQVSLPLLVPGCMGSS